MEKRVYFANEKIPVKIAGTVFGFPNKEQLIINKEKIEEVKVNFAEKKVAPAQQQAKVKKIDNAEQLKQIKKEAVKLEEVKEKPNLELINLELKEKIEKIEIKDIAYTYFLNISTLKDEIINKDSIEIKPGEDIRVAIIKSLEKQGDNLELKNQYKLVFTVKAEWNAGKNSLKADTDPIVVTLLEAKKN